MPTSPSGCSDLSILYTNKGPSIQSSFNVLIKLGEVMHFNKLDFIAARLDRLCPKEDNTFWDENEHERHVKLLE